MISLPVFTFLFVSFECYPHNLKMGCGEYHFSVAEARMRKM